MRSDFENAFTYAPIGMALVDMDGRWLQVNDALCRITGYTAEEICARPFRDSQTRTTPTSTPARSRTCSTATSRATRSKSATATPGVIWSGCC